MIIGIKNIRVCLREQAQQSELWFVLIVPYHERLIFNLENILFIERKKLLRPVGLQVLTAAEYNIFLVINLFFHRDLVRTI